MKKIIISLFCFMVLLFAIFLHVKTTTPAYAVMCFLKSEYVDGMNKICIYDCPSGSAAITVAGYQLCPLSIDR